MSTRRRIYICSRMRVTRSPIVVALSGNGSSNNNRASDAGNSAGSRRPSERRLWSGEHIRSFDIAIAGRAGDTSHEADAGNIQLRVARRLMQ